MKFCNYRVYICLSANIDQLEIKLQKRKAEKNKNQKKKSKLTFLGNFPFSSPSFSGAFRIRQWPTSHTPLLFFPLCREDPTRQRRHVSASWHALSFFLFFSLTARPRSSSPSFLSRARATEARPTPPRRRTDFFRAQTLPPCAHDPAALLPKEILSCPRRNRAVFEPFFPNLSLRATSFKTANSIPIRVGIGPPPAYIKPRTSSRARHPRKSTPRPRRRAPSTPSRQTSSRALLEPPQLPRTA